MCHKSLKADVSHNWNQICMSRPRNRDMEGLTNGTKAVRVHIPPLQHVWGMPEVVVLVVLQD